MNIVSSLNGLDIKPEEGVNKAIFQVSKLVNESTNRLSKANKIINDLGGPKLKHERYAILISQAMVEYAVQHVEDYNAENAFQAAEIRYQDLKEKMPWACLEPEVKRYKPLVSKRKSRIKRESKNDNNKKKEAIGIFEANKEKTNGEIAKIIAGELKITYANAYYYVSRVFKR